MERSGKRCCKFTRELSHRVGYRNLWRTLSSKNVCKTCALGMGGQQGGMRNEQGHWPEVCKKSIQAATADMQAAIQPNFYHQYSINQLKKFSPKKLEQAGRISTPLLLKPGSKHYQPIDWTAALDRLAQKLKQTDPSRAFFYFSGRSSNEAGFLLQLFARIFGTNHINNCSYYCHQASGVGLSQSLGTGTATIQLEDLDHCDLLFLMGANPSSNHPRLLTKLKNIRQRGGKVIVINPVVEKGLIEFRIPSNLKSLLFGSKIASEYIQVRPGGRIGKSYIVAKNAVFSWCMGITHHAHGAATVQNIVNLALLRGMIGKKNAGVLPIRGHSNVQGMGSMGVTPALKKAVFNQLTAEGVIVPSFKGYDTMACIQASYKGEMDFAFCLGGNLYGSNPDSNSATQAFSNIDTVVYLSTTLNTGHAWGTGKETIIIPVLARDEEHQSTTQESMFNFVRLSDGGIKRFPSLQSEVEFRASFQVLSLFLI